jgi:bidirectional [NiFe] hydrogenase diaphorase subunit
MALIKTIIDGREIEVERDRWALDVAREMGISIPTLCHHAALEPYGACRLCVVEVTKGKWTWLTTSCDLPIREGLSIRTDTEAVKKARRIAIELLLARAPEAQSLQSMAKEFGVEKQRFTVRHDIGKCILCGLCVRVCDKLIGVSAIGFVNRAARRRVGTPFDKASGTCIGCNACVAVCPTGHIVSVDKGSVRHMETWQTDLEMVACGMCQKPYMPAKQFEQVQGRLGKGMTLEKLCPACLRSKTVSRMTAVAGAVIDR